MIDINDTAARIGCITASIRDIAVDADGFDGEAHYLLAIEIMAEEARRLAEGIERAEMAERGRARRKKAFNQRRETSHED